MVESFLKARERAAPANDPPIALSAGAIGILCKARRNRFNQNDR
jgi:hypothetical protein